MNRSELYMAIDARMQAVDRALRLQLAQPGATISACKSTTVGDLSTPIYDLVAVLRAIEQGELGVNILDRSRSHKLTNLAEFQELQHYIDESKVVLNRWCSCSSPTSKPRQCLNNK